MVAKRKLNKRKNVKGRYEKLSNAMVKRAGQTLHHTAAVRGDEKIVSASPPQENGWMIADGGYLEPI